MPNPLVISHAACGGHAPENTLAGLRLALHMGADAIEIDVHLSADGVPILMHDDSVDRTTDGQGAVASLTLAELWELDASARSPFETFRGEKVPTLAEALELTRGRALLVIEIKPPDIENEVLEAVRRAGALHWAMVWSFHPTVVAEVRRREPRLPAGLLTLNLSDAIAEQALELGAQATGVFHQNLSEGRVRQARRKALAVHAWTADEPMEMRRLATAGVDGIVTNFPDRARSFLRAHEASWPR
jgi:glycerophosphoryl diester phosphodiesterase